MTLPAAPPCGHEHHTAAAPRAGDVPRPHLVWPEKPLLEVRVGRDTLVALHRVAAADHQSPRRERWAVIATALDGAYRSTLATGVGGTALDVPDVVMGQCLRTAGILYGHQTQVVAR